MTSCKYRLTPGLCVLTCSGDTSLPVSSLIESPSNRWFGPVFDLGFLFSRDSKLITIAPHNERVALRVFERALSTCSQHADSLCLESKSSDQIAHRPFHSLMRLKASPSWKCKRLCRPRYKHAQDRRHIRADEAVHARKL